MKFKIIENKKILKESASQQLTYILNNKNKIPNLQIRNSGFPYETTHELIADLEKLGSMDFRIKNKNIISTQKGLTLLQKIIQSSHKYD